jgi:hypothetical protein
MLILCINQEQSSVSIEVKLDRTEEPDAHLWLATKSAAD